MVACYLSFVFLNLSSIAAMKLSEAEQLRLDLGPYLILTFFNAVYVISLPLAAVANVIISLYGMLCLQCHLFFQASFKRPRGKLACYSVRIDITAAQYD